MVGGKYKFMVGANGYAHESVLKFRLDWSLPDSRYLQAPSARVLGRLRRFLPRLGDETPDAACVDAQGQVGLWTEHGLDLGRVALSAMVSLHHEVGLDCRVCHACDLTHPQRAISVCTCDTLKISAEALRVVLKFLDQLGPAEPADQPDPTVLRQEFVRFAAPQMLKVDLTYLMDQARRRDIPALHIGDKRVVFGHGCRQRNMRRQVGDQTSHLGYMTAVDKHRSYEFMQRVGLPVPRQFAVYDQAAAQRAAESIGYPVVIKPAASDFGTGITVGAIDSPAVARAFKRARRYGNCVIVEQFIAGDDHRLLLINGAVVAAARRIPGGVVGDGEHTVAELIAFENRNPQRGDANFSTTPLSRLLLDEEAREVLRLAGRTAQSVPERGEHVLLRRMSNISQGGTSLDVTETVHPDYKEAAVLAAQVIGLDIAGVDFITTDISRSWREIGGAICEINPSPGMRMHHSPHAGPARDVATPIFNLLFPNGTPARIPVAALTGSNGKTTTTRMVAHILRAGGATVGMVCTEGVFVQDQCLEEGDCSGGIFAQRILLDPRIDAAVLEIARGAILKFGAGITGCDVAAVLNIADEHLGELGVERLEDLAAAKGLLVELARDTVILNADDPNCVALAPRSRARHLCYVSMQKMPPLLAAHLQRGGRALTLDSDETADWVMWHDSGSSRRLFDARLLPSSRSGRATFNIQNAMFAAATALALGQPSAEVARALATFHGDEQDNLGRLNHCPGLPFEVIIDYCHNRHGIEALGRYARASRIKGQALLAFSLPGNRRDEDFLSAAGAAARYFDVFVPYPGLKKYLRGRGEAECTDLLAQGFRAQSPAEERLHIAKDWLEAAQFLLEMAKPGDCVFLTGLNPQQLHAEVQRFRAKADPV